MNFNTIFNNFLGNETIYHLSIITGIERTKLQRIKTGQRLPNSKEVEIISKSLSLSSEEKRLLKESLLIDKIGQEKYLSRKATVKFLEEIDEISSKKEENNKIKITNKSFVSFDNEITSTSNFQETVDVIQAIISSESNNPNINSDIYIFSDAIEEHFFNSIKHALSQNNNLNIKHIIIFRTHSKETSPYLYNINVIKKIYPLFVIGNSYKPYYSYSSTDSNTLFPYYIITNNYFINISKNFKSSIISTNKKVINTAKSEFNEYLSSTTPLVKEINNVFDYSNYYLTEISKILSKSLTKYSIEYEPCLTTFITKEMLISVMRTDYEGSSEILNRAITYFSYYKEYGFNDSTIFFLKDGLDNFIKTGRIMEIPDYVYNPLPVEMRKQVLSSLLSFYEKNPTYCSIMINSKKLKVPSTLRYWGSGTSSDYFMLLSELHNGMRSFFFQNEIGMTAPFSDFVASLKNSEYVFSREETLKYIKQKINEL